MRRFFVGITGASGHAYAEGVIRALVAAGHGVDLSVTGAGAQVIAHELGVDVGERGVKLASALPGWLGPEVAEHVRAFQLDEVGAPPSSGTSLTGGTILVPCSMGTMARVAAGFSSNLVERVADVALKERRRLIIVPRETPVSEVHLTNMLTLLRMGAAVLPAMPGFYHLPKTIDDLVNHIVGKVLDTLGVENAVGARWSGLEPEGDEGTSRRNSDQGAD